jgi:rhamnosyltransferase
MIKLAVAVILYHPPDNVLKNVSSYYDSVDRMYIFDNTENDNASILFTGLNKVSYLHDGTNRGIAERLNAACQMAIAEGYEWLLTMDQDTNFPEEVFQGYLRCVEEFPTKENVALFGPEYERFITDNTIGCDYQESAYIITSGMLVNLKLSNKIGLFDEALFIDGVDHEYCLRANTMGLKTIQFTQVYLHHSVGEEVYRASFKSLYLSKKKKIVHTPLRCYYMYRNFLYLKKKYEQVFPAWVKHNHKIITTHLKWSFFYNGKALQTLLHILKAKADFKNNNMGKLNKA